MSPWVLLSLAIGLEVVATLSLRMAALGRRTWFVVVVLGYAGAFVALSAALSGGLGLGVAYGVWAAAGVALTAVASRLVFREPLTPVMGLGIALIMGGVLLVELGATH